MAAAEVAILEETGAILRHPLAAPAWLGRRGRDDAAEAEQSNGRDDECAFGHDRRDCIPGTSPSSTGPCIVGAMTFAFLLALAAAPALAAEPGKATGTVTIDGVATTMTLAVSSDAESLLDDKKKDLLITITDRALGDAEAGDDVSLSMRARKGELVVFVLRLDGTKLTNVSVMHKGLSGVVKLPGQWFTFASTGKGAGTLKLAKKEFDGHAYACDLTFSGAPAVKKTAPPPPAPAPAPAPAPKASRAQPLPPASTSSIEPKAATAMFVAAAMQKDE